ncbi:hypothetical protein GH714_023211 [Hevea brasiliensis]|uniref:Uncharacterized protein n=1 Tax=Hevea brasiliensis TaxID=3981 RepID=A0A6A6NIR1_HEVBR|nr:hypothetical protein GH714_023211 [Hevea brasiliensis]
MENIDGISKQVSNNSSYAYNGKIILCSGIILFTVIVIMVFFHSYARWIFKRRHAVATFFLPPSPLPLPVLPTERLTHLFWKLFLLWFTVRKRRTQCSNAPFAYPNSKMVRRGECCPIVSTLFMFAVSIFGFTLTPTVRSVERQFNHTKFPKHVPKQWCQWLKRPVYSLNRGRTKKMMGVALLLRRRRVYPGSHQTWWVYLWSWRYPRPQPTAPNDWSTLVEQYATTLITRLIALKGLGRTRKRTSQSAATRDNGTEARIQKRNRHSIVH